MNIDAKAIARKYINDLATDTDSLGDYLTSEDGTDELSPEAFDALKDEVSELIENAAITVSWDDDEQAETAPGGEA
jgi:hypothetical protein